MICMQARKAFNFSYWEVDHTDNLTYNFWTVGENFKINEREKTRIEQVISFLKG